MTLVRGTMTHNPIKARLSATYDWLTGNSLGRQVFMLAFPATSKRNVDNSLREVNT